MCKAGPEGIPSHSIRVSPLRTEVMNKAIAGAGTTLLSASRAPVSCGLEVCSSLAPEFTEKQILL